VKGSIISGVVEDLLDHQRSGRLSEDQVGASLEASDIKVLEDKPTASAWYPMASYTRLLELLYTVEGGGRDRAAYFEARGAKNAQRLFEAGLYQQLSFVDRWAEDATDGRTGERAIVAFERNLKLVLTLSSSIYRGGEWRVEGDPSNPSRFRVVVEAATEYSAPMRSAALGFLNECARPRQGQRPELFIGDLAQPERFCFSMSLDIESMRPAK
jgi:hypothetical protein